MVLVILSFVLALMSHGIFISRDPLANGPTVWSFTLERNLFAREPILWGLFREFPSKTDFNSVLFFLSLFIDFMTWLVVLVAASRLMRTLCGSKAYRTGLS